MSRSAIASLRRSGTMPLHSRCPRLDVSGVDRTLLAVEAERVEAPILQPERLVEAASQLRRVVLELLGQSVVAPDLPRDLGDPQLRVVDVALHLDGRDRRHGERPVVEGHRVLGVLPGLVADPVRAAALVLDESVPVGVRRAVDPGERAPSRVLELEREASDRRSSARAPREG